MRDEAVTIATSADGTQIAWAERGGGPPLLLIQGLGYAGILGLGAGARAARPDASA